MCNSFVDFLLEIISFLTVPPEGDLFTSEAVFIKKNYKPSKQVHVNIQHISDFWEYEMLYHIILYQQFFFYLDLYKLHKPYHVENKLSLIRFW